MVVSRERKRLSWSRGRDISRKALSVGDNGCDAQGCGCLHATSEWMSGSSLVKRERAIGPRERRGRIGGPESLKPWPSLPTLHHLTFSFTATSIAVTCDCSLVYMYYLDHGRNFITLSKVTCTVSIECRWSRKTACNRHQLHNRHIVSVRNGWFELYFDRCFAHED
jgi:hypothetical protein